MTRVIKWWKRTRIWGKVRDSCALLGTGTTITLEGADVQGFWAYFVMLITVLGTLLGIWMNDANQDGIADIFQDDPAQTGVQRNEP